MNSIAAEVRGVVIESVQATSDAGQKGLKRGDVVVRAGDTVAGSPADVPAAVDAAKRAAFSASARYEDPGSWRRRRLQR